MDTPVLIRQIQSRIGDGIGAVITQQDILDWINEAQIEIARDTGYSSLDVNINMSTYLAAGYFQLAPHTMIRYVLVDNVPLEIKDPRFFDTAYGRNDSVGLPKFYYQITGGQDTTNDPDATAQARFKLYPAPDPSYSASIITVSMGSIPTNLAAVTSPLDLPAAYHPDVMNFCMMRAHERMKDWQGMNAAATAYQARLSKRVEAAETVEETWVVQSDELFGEYY